MSFPFADQYIQIAAHRDIRKLYDYAASRNSSWFKNQEPFRFARKNDWNNCFQQKRAIVFSLFSITSMNKQIHACRY